MRASAKLTATDPYQPQNAATTSRVEFSRNSPNTAACASGSSPADPDLRDAELLS